MRPSFKQASSMILLLEQELSNHYSMRVDDCRSVCSVKDGKLEVFLKAVGQGRTYLIQDPLPLSSFESVSIPAGVFLGEALERFRAREKFWQKFMRSRLSAKHSIVFCKNWLPTILNDIQETQRASGLSGIEVRLMFCARKAVLPFTSSQRLGFTLPSDVLRTVWKKVMTEK